MTPAVLILVGAAVGLPVGAAVAWALRDLIDPAELGRCTICAAPTDICWDDGWHPPVWCCATHAEHIGGNLNQQKGTA